MRKLLRGTGPLWALTWMLASCLLGGGCTDPAVTSTVVFAEGSEGCHYYRIPAMCLDKDGNVVAVVDRRYESLADLGYRNTSIDISTRRSTDGGRTWSPQTFIARGDTSRYLGYGFGDASLTLTRSGKIVCVMAPGRGRAGFRRGLTHTAVSVSEDGGVSWSEPRLIPFPDTLHSAFATSGKGIVDADGDILLTYIGLLTLGKTAYDSVHEFDDDPDYYQTALGIARGIPSAETIRQRMDDIGDSLRANLLDANVDMFRFSKRIARRRSSC